MYRTSPVRMHENKEAMKQLADQFLAEKPKKRVFNNFRIEGNKLIYHSRETFETRSLWYDKVRDKGIEEVERIIKGIEDGIYELHSDEDLNYIKEQLQKVKTKENSYMSSFKYSMTCTDTIAAKLPSGLVVGNSSVLRNVGKTVAYGNVSHNNEETIIQRILSEKISMIPFNVFEEAKLDLSTMKIVNQTGAETLAVKERYRDPHERWNWKERVVTRHFTGATLFECDGKQFLFDVDRNEIKHQIFNAFLVELPKKVKTVAEAYELLKPEAVKEAIKKGLDVKRQGEWFFIPCKAPAMPKFNKEQGLITLLRATGCMEENGDVARWRSNVVVNQIAKIIGKDRLRFLTKQANRFLDMIPRAAQLKVGNNRPNNAELVVTVKGITYVKGKVTHSGREHKDLKLETWHRAIPNTANKSFTIIGDVD